MTHTVDPLDELTSMFLTDAETAAAARGAAAAPSGAAMAPHDAGGGAAVAVEFLLVGHLPVRAGIWLTPYADAVAREAGATALVRLDGEEPTLQMLWGWGDPAGAEVALESGRSLRETIDGLGGVTRRWIVRPSAQTAMDELLASMRRADAGGFGATEGGGRPGDNVTILSSSNDLAVVRAYRHVKMLGDVAARAGRALPFIALAVLGAPEEEARRMARNLTLTTRRTMDVTVPLALTLPRMDAGIRASVLRTFPGQPRPSLEEVRGWIEEAQRTAVTAASPAGGATGMPREVVDERIERDELRPEDVTISDRAVRRGAARPLVADDPIPAATPAAARPGANAPAATAGGPPFVPPLEPPVAPRSPRAPVGPAAAAAAPAPAPPPAPVSPSAPAAAPTGERSAPFPPPIEGAFPCRTMRMVPSAATEIEPKAPCPEFEPHRGGRPIPLSEHVEGLQPLRPRCPHHPEIELAVDPRGRVHLLGRADALRGMQVVSAWVRSHREVLALACPEHQLDPRGRSVCHLFTAHPLDVADLHGSDVNLHLLAAVDVEGKRAWYAARLNKGRD